MKYSLIYLTCIAFLLGACKKENGTSDDTTPDPNAPAYTITAPACLIETDSSSSLWGRNYYDSQKRLVMRCAHLTYSQHDSSIETYTYHNNTITEVSRTITKNGSETVKTCIHYLNSMGLIDSSVGEFFSPSTTSIHYVYNNAGYLVRSLYYSGAVPGTGNSFLYTGGNRTATYHLNFDGETGMLMDSSLGNTFTYYSDLPGKIDASWAWTSRTGRANMKARKDVLDNSGNIVITYSYTIENGLPAVRPATYGGNTYYTWKCN